MNAPYGYQHSQVNVTQQVFGISDGYNLVARFEGAQWPGILVDRLSVTGPQVPAGINPRTGVNYLLRVYRDSMAATSQLTVQDKTDSANWAPQRPQRLNPGSSLIVVWEGCAASTVRAIATMQCEVAP